MPEKHTTSLAKLSVIHSTLPDGQSVQIGMNHLKVFLQSLLELIVVEGHAGKQKVEKYRGGSMDTHVLNF
jgi:hypothetical protein